MTKKITWRLKTLPTPDEVRELVKDKIITQEEARDILFNSEKETDENSLKEEIKFLRDLVEKLSHGNRTTIVETIREVQKPYYQLDWYRPYEVYCAGFISANCSGLVTNYASSASLANNSFSSINTF